MEGTFACLLVVLLLSVTHGIHAADDCVVLAPNSVQLEETILVINRGDSKYITLQVQDFPARLNTFYRETIYLEKDELRHVMLRTGVQQVPRDEAYATRYTVLSVQCGSIYTKEARLRVSEKSGYLFLQTDKPIYTPKQAVQIRCVAVREGLQPLQDPISLEIKNPQDIITYKTSFPGNGTGMFSHSYSFPRSPLLGEWTVTAAYGPHPDEMTEVKFKVDEYVLPTFSVNLTVPSVILSHQETVTGGVSARYVYGKPVQGSAVFRFKLKNEGNIENEIGSVSYKELIDGTTSFTIRTNDLKKPRSQSWAPMVEKSRLVVEVTVMDGASGKREFAVNEDAIFAKSPYLISFKPTPKDFRPGTTTIVVAVVVHPNSTPAPYVRTEITVWDEREQRVPLDVEYSITDGDGKAIFFIHTQMDHKRLKCKVRTADARYQYHQQEENIITLVAHESPTNASLALKRVDTRRRYQVGDHFDSHVTILPAELHPVYFVVLSRGHVEHYGTVAPGMPLGFPVSHSMSPRSRVLVYAFHGGHLLADSLVFQVQETCTDSSQIEIETAFTTHEPGEEGALRVKGTERTLVGILAVDQAVYILRRRDLLTRNRLFGAFRSHDLGCGPGGGLTPDAVIANSGVVIISRHLLEDTLRTDNSCEERARKRRSLMRSSRDAYVDPYLQNCCRLGQRTDKFHRDCRVRAEIVRRFLVSHPQGNGCADAFHLCCFVIAHGRPGYPGRPSTGAYGDKDHPDRARVNPKYPEGDPLTEEDLDDASIQLRHNFQETWLFEEKVIPAGGVAEFQSSLPHSITTWLVQAVSVSPEGGVCVAEPRDVRSFRNVFLQVSLPYKVVRNEQIEVLVTVYNYGQSHLRGNVFMYGVDGLCTGAADGERTERQRVSVAASSASSVTFPVIPLREGEFKIRVVVVSTRGRDKVEKILNVVPEGITVEKSISVAIDPTNERRRRTRSVRGDRYQDSLDPAAKVQVIAVNTRLPPDAVPDTKHCSVSVIGDKLGPSVHTTLNNLEDLIAMPRGCGEQNMMLMAPTLYTLDYLKKKGDSNETVEEKAYKYLRTGYERQLTYRQKDGSFSAFRHRPSSVWLTAFVMRVFCRARSYLSIDPTVVQSGMQWLASKQLADGSFEELKPIMHRSMLGGVQGKLPMTAFVLLTFYECFDATSEDMLRNTTTRAETFLSQRVYETHEAYIAALVAYALSLTGGRASRDALDALEYKMHHNIEMSTIYTGREGTALDVEGSSYALLAYLKHGKIESSNQVVNWLNMQRTASGSFQSTQDTVVALQALSEYALQTRDPHLDLMCNITLSNQRDFKKSIRVRRDNAAILQQLDLADVTGKMYVSASGFGSGLLSVKLKYNMVVAPEVLCRFNITVSTDVHQPMKQRKDRNLDFPPGLLENLGLELDRRRRSASWSQGIMSLSRSRNWQPGGRVPSPLHLDSRHRVGSSSGDSKTEDRPENLRRGRSKLTYDLEVCTRYLEHGDSNMAVVDVGLFSGFDPIKEDLEKLREDKIIDKHEVLDNHVVLYFEKITSLQSICVKFRIERNYVVNNVQAAAVKVYDYYNPMHSCSQLYAPASTSPLLKVICEGEQCQCAEDGCPVKEPFANLHRANNSAARRLLWNITCNEYDFVWRGRVLENKQKNGFRSITFRVSKVIKEGAESSDDMHGYDREIVSRDYCKEADLLRGHDYYLFGHDREPFENSNGTVSYRYHMDRRTKIFWDSSRNPDHRKLGGIFQWLSSGFMRQQECVS